MMHYSRRVSSILMTIVVVVLLPSLTHATNPVIIGILQGLAPPYYGQGPYGNMCASYSLFDRTSAASPLASDCLKLAAWFKATDNKLWHMYDWNFPLGAYRRLYPEAEGWREGVEEGNSCVFGIRFPAALDKVVMSGKDIADLIELSVNAFARVVEPEGGNFGFGWKNERSKAETRVGSEGKIKCMSLKPLHEVNRWVEVEFGIFFRKNRKVR